MSLSKPHAFPSPPAPSSCPAVTLHASRGGKFKRTHRGFTYCSSSCLSLRCFPSAPHRSFHCPCLLLRTFFPQMLQGGARSLSALPGTSSGRLPWSRPGLPPSFPVLLFGTAVITAQISYVFKRLPPHQVLSSTQEGLCVRSAHCCVLNNKHYLAYSRCSNVCWREVKEEIKRK